MPGVGAGRVGVLVAGLMASGTAAELDERPPNLIVILADDLGYGDLSCYDGWVDTPCLDRMAEEGLRFTDFHTSGTVCSPTRAGMITGRYQQRAGLGVVVNADPKQPDHHRGLQARERTLPEQLAEAGYRSALIGKWHLGYTAEFNPLRHGFERFRGFVSGNIDYVSHLDRMGAADWWRDASLVEEEGYLTELLTDHALAFLDAAGEGPFFLQLAHGAVHAPIQAPGDPPGRGPESRELDPARPKKETVRRMTRALDRSVGRLLQALRRRGRERDTLVVFLSDNGGAPHMRNHPLRGGKGSEWEGGHRVPAIAWWPGRIEAGVSHALGSSLDLMPTFLELAGLALPQDRPLDGRSLREHLLERAPLGERELFWNGKAMRRGDWKLIRTRSAGERRTQLFDLSRDLGERHDLAAEEPERLASMSAALDAWWTEVQADVTPQPRLQAFLDGR